MADIFPLGEKTLPGNFTGTAFHNLLVAPSEVFKFAVRNVVFELGSRNHWHFHPAGQILIATQGEGYFQERGKPPQLLRPGDVLEIQPNVVHWHGATPTSKFGHICITNKTPDGVVMWLEPVTDEEYPKP
jgi:quercetin dioxygenase-like cupin family protein